MEKAFWKNKRVLITGYEGFLGSWLTRFLLQAGAQVTGLDILTHRKKTILTSAELAAMRPVKGSVTDLSLVSSLLRRQKTQVVFHLAAEALVNDCFDHPLKAFQTNIAGTWSVLEACRHAQTVKAVVSASSDKAYGSHKKLPYREDAPLQADHPYDVSKSCADLLCKTYWNTYAVPVCVTRCGNLYGPGDFNFSRIVPEAMRCALTGDTLVLRSDGTFVRDYVYVKDIALAYLLLAQKMAAKPRLCGEAFNFSDEIPLSVKAIVKAVYSAAGAMPRLKILDRAKFEIKDQYLESAKARKLLGWKPRYSLQDALQETLGWYSTVI
jgi:CDP-glucose 4,6-dehydratase